MSRFRIDFPYTELTIDQIWPDGNAPQSPTASDVMNVMNESGGLLSVLSDWNLVPYIEINGEMYS